MDCQNLREKAIVLAELSSREKDKVSEHLANCQECSLLMHDYDLILHSIKAVPPVSHLEPALLTKYAVHLEDPGSTDYDGRELSASELRTVQHHLGECIGCQKTVNELRHEYRELAQHFDETALGRLTDTSNTSTAIGAALTGLKRLCTQLLSSAPLPSFYPLAAGAAAAFCLVLWYGPFFRNTNPYFELVNLQVEPQHFATRAGSAAHLDDGLAAFNSGRFDDAIASLEQFTLAEDSDEVTHAFALSVLGVAHIQSATSDILGRFSSIDLERVDRGIDYLIASSEMTNNPRINENNFWFAANGYLLKSDVTRARSYLTEVVQGRGKRAQAAKELLRAIQ